MWKFIRVSMRIFLMIMNKLDNDNNEIGVGRSMKHYIIDNQIKSHEHVAILYQNTKQKKEETLIALFSQISIPTHLY